MKNQKCSFLHKGLPIIHLSIIDLFLCIFCTTSVLSVSQTIIGDIYIGEAFIVEETQQLNFGKFMTGEGNGYIQISPEGKQTVNCKYCSVIASPKPGLISISGSDLSGLRISVSDIKIYNDKGDSVNIDNFNAVYKAPSSTNTVGELAIGGRMNFTGKETSGEYSGIYNVTVMFP